MSKESKIRDYYAANINEVSPDLTFVDKEYYLPNSEGTRGFIDILAKDQMDNYVIIEIKREKKASREAIHEVFKYAGLLKMKYGIKNSQIKIIIISTVWDELIVPFSDFYHNSDYDIKGYKNTVDSSYIPNGIEVVVPLEISRFKKELSDWHLVIRSIEASLLEEEVNKVKTIFNRSKIKDFILIHLEDGVSFAKYLTFRKLEDNEYFNFLKTCGFCNEYIEELRNDESGYETKEEYYNYLESLLLEEVSKLFDYNNVQIANSSPEHALNYLKKELVKGVERSGIYEENPILSDLALLKMTMGIEGKNRNVYSTISGSKNKQRIDEIKEEIDILLSQNKFWKHTISVILDELKGQEDFNLSLLIISDNIINSISNGLYPHYEIFIDYYKKKEVHIFTGRLAWDGTTVPNITSFLDEFYANEDDLFFDLLSGQIELKNRDFMKKLGMTYVSHLSIINEDEDSESKFLIEIDHGEIEKLDIPDTRYSYDFSEYSPILSSELKTLLNNGFLLFVKKDETGE